MSSQTPTDIIPAPVPAPGPAEAQAYERAFDATRAERDAIAADEKSTVFADVMSAAGRARSAAQRAAKYDAELAKLPILQGLRLNVIRNADAAAGAHIRYVNADRKPAVIIPKIEYLRGKRDVLLSDVKALVSHELVQAERLEGINGTMGHRAITYDVLILTGGMLQEWEKLEGRTAYSRADLQDLNRQAQEAEQAVQLREDQERERDEAAEQRQRAFTLLVRAYDELRHAMGFILRYAAPEVLASAVPPLQNGRPRKSKDDDAEEPEPAPTPASPSPAVPVPMNPAAPSAPKLNPFTDD